MKTMAGARFQRDHPKRSRLVFLMMGYDPTPMRTRVRDLITAEGRAVDHDVIRADDVDYSGELWTNAQLCLDHCALGIAVIDRNDQTAQNIAVELGYLLAKGTPCMILREHTLPPPPAVLAHRLHSPFEAFDLDRTLAVPVRRWLAEQATPAGRFGGFR
jgi:hypothetical protein